MSIADLVGLLVENPREGFDFDASRREVDSIQPFERSVMGYLFPHCRTSISLSNFLSVSRLVWRK